MSDEEPGIWPWTIDPTPEPFTTLDWAVIVVAVAMFALVAIGVTRFFLGSDAA